MLVGAYLEDFGLIKAIIPSHLSINFDNIYLYKENQKILKLRVKNDEYYALEHHLYLAYEEELDLHTDYNVNFDGELELFLKQGKIIRSEKFDQTFTYDGPLGITYQKNKTIFRVWAPTAKVIKVVLFKSAAIYKSLELLPKDKGLWEIEVEGDLKGIGYRYIVRIDKDEVEALDPYAISSAIKHGVYLNYVVDKDELLRNIEDDIKPKFEIKEEVIYELHLKDYTDEIKEEASCFKAFTENRCIIDHLKNIGTNTIQVLPLNTFKGIDEINKDAMYNWGYNPLEYNTVSGWYASDATNELNPIYELQNMVKKLHSEGIKINLDVVYNHVYLPKLFGYHNLVPGYFFRTDERGFLTDGSGCGNDFATERKMARRFILDSLKYWQLMYHIDGFRFDLMGLIDLETMEKIQKEIPDAHLYGEGWIISTGIPMEKCANMLNAIKIPSIGFFNDIFRNIMRGTPFDHQKGFLAGRDVSIDDFAAIMKGSLNYHFVDDIQAINYVECHDNKTLYDYLCHFVNQAQIIDYMALAFGVTLLAKGIPFIHAGEEILGTKNDLDNTYNDNTGINTFKWANISKYPQLLMALKSLSDIRKEYMLFNKEIIYTDFSKQNSYYHFKIKGKANLEVFVKNNYEHNSIKFLGGAIMIYNGIEKVEIKIDELLIFKPGVYIVKTN